MKKILTLISALGLTINSGTLVSSCSSVSDSKKHDIPVKPKEMTIDKIKDTFKQTTINIKNEWQSFWGDWNESINGTKYYYLLFKKLCYQNNIHNIEKYEKYFFKNPINPKVIEKIPNLDLDKLNQKNNYKSSTDFKIWIHVNNNYNLLWLHVNWTLTSDQRMIFPLINELRTQKKELIKKGYPKTSHNYLSIYDDRVIGYINNQIKNKDYAQKIFKKAFNEQFWKNNYKYTNLAKEINNNYLGFNKGFTSCKLIIKYNQSHYINNDFEIHVYNIKNLFDIITKEYNEGYILGNDWSDSNASKDKDEILEQLVESIPNLDNLENYENKISFEGTLPTSKSSGFKTIKMIYTDSQKNSISTYVKVGN